MTNPHWLEITEYISLAASVVGTIAATANQQIAVGLTPITLTIALNIINRQRIYQLNQQHKEAEISQIASLNQRLNQLEIRNQQINLKTQQVNPQIQEQLGEIKEAIAPIMTLNQRIAHLEKISQQINDQLIESVKTFNTQMDSVNQRLLQLEISEKQINPQIQQQFAELKYAISHIDNLYEFFAKLKKIETLNESPPSVPPQYRKESIFQEEEKTSTEGEDNQTESNQKTSGAEKPESRWQNDIEQGKREIEDGVKKLGESLNNLFKP